MRNSVAWNMTIPQLNYLVASPFRYGMMPDLAVSWDVASDGLSYTFKLHPDAAWQDGKPVTADDVVFSLRRIKGLEDLKTPAYSATMSAVDTVEAVDPKTVRVKMSRLSAGWLAGLGLIGNMMYPKHVDPATYQFTGAPVGSGPFKFVSFTPDIKGVLVRNDKYWKKDEFGRRLPYVDGLEFFVIQDQAAERAALTTGQVDMGGTQSFPWIGLTDELKKRVPGVQLNTYYNPWGVFFNGTRSIFQDQRIRTAFQLAVDRPAANNIGFSNEGNPYHLYNAWGGQYAFTADELKAFPGFNPDKQQDIAKAKELLVSFLKDNNLTLDSWRPDLLTRQEQAVGQLYADILAAQLKANLGITVKMSSVDNPTNIDRLAKKNFDIVIQGLALSGDDPVLNIGAYTLCNSGQNFGGYCDPDLDKLVFQLDAALDSPSRQKLSKQLERKAYDLAWHVIIVAAPSTTVARPYVKGMWQVGHAQDSYISMRERVWFDK